MFSVIASPFQLVTLIKISSADLYFTDELSGILCIIAYTQSLYFNIKLGVVSIDKVVPSRVWTYM